MSRGLKPAVGGGLGLGDLTDAESPILPGLFTYPPQKNAIEPGGEYAVRAFTQG